MVAVAQLIKIFHIMCQNHRKRNPLHIFPVKKTRAVCILSANADCLLQLKRFLCFSLKNRACPVSNKGTH
ncbi:hypothetical protein MtrunA17_Chr4g0050791 [Medicago truncatula]|uniref:Uncharacterized protein n=1 Tax=Medicago truncatula TaxID=3880 RepID=A0A396IAY5_MEDTR|nr:hypothetical protein MtrunA17_Chr4g0050791 [Medicago truncatula]